MANLSSNSTLTPSFGELFNQLGFKTWHTVMNTFALPLINLTGVGLCSLSLWIFTRAPFAEPIFFYYRLLCAVNIIHLLHNTFYGISFLPVYFPWLNTYAISVYQIYYGCVSIFLFHFEDVLRMGILLHKMKLFSSFVRKHFTASPQFISFTFFLTCLLIQSPSWFALEIGTLGEYYYFDTNGMKTNAATYYFPFKTEFSSTLLGQIVLGASTFILNLVFCLVVGITLKVAFYIKYKHHAEKRRRQVDELQMSSIHNRPTTSRELTQLRQREESERKIQKNMLYMVITLSSISILSRLAFMTCYLYIFIFFSFSNSLSLLVITNSIYTFGPTVSILVFYSFNQMFNSEINKCVFSRKPLIGTREIRENRI